MSAALLTTPQCFPNSDREQERARQHRAAGNCSCIRLASPVSLRGCRRPRLCQELQSLVRRRPIVPVRLAASAASDEHDLKSIGIRYGLRTAVAKATALGLALCVACSPATCEAAPVPDLTSTDASREQYERAVRQHSPRSNLPSQGEAEVLLQLPKELFTDDAWEGMKTILEVARYVEARLPAEEEKGCENCAANRKMLEKAWQIVASEYFDPRGQFSQASWARQLLLTLQGTGGVLHTRQETYVAMTDMLASLHDKYTEFLTPSQFRRALRRPHPAERDYLERQFTGVGLQLGKHSSRGGWLVEGPLAESPAEEGGIQPGQRVVEIDGYPADLLSPLEVAALMRGPAGSSVIITLAENVPHSKTWKIDLERRALPQPPLKLAVLPGPHGPLQYIRVHYFSGEASRSFAAALKEAEGSGRYGIIIDLRNNPGGVFEEAIWMASLLVDPGRDIAETVRNSDVIDTVFTAGSLPRQIFARQLGKLTDIPVVALINHGSASASEVFAGALQDNHRATLVGEQSFGKGVVQHYFPFEDGSGLKVTVAKYLTPLKHDISREGGINPDFACQDYPHPGEVSPTNDSCIQKAVDSFL